MPAGELLGGAAPDAPSAAAARDAWFGAEPWTVPGTRTLVSGRATGTLVGGNLALLAATVGTPYAPPDAACGVVVLEDVHEPPYRVDRMLTQLLQARWFDGVLGIALGQLTGCGGADEVLVERLTPLGAPVLAGLAVGHGRPQLSVVLGDRVDLDADAQVLRQGVSGRPAHCRSDGWVRTACPGLRVSSVRLAPCLPLVLASAATLPSPSPGSGSVLLAIGGGW